MTTDATVGDLEARLAALEADTARRLAVQEAPARITALTAERRPLAAAQAGAELGRNVARQEYVDLQHAEIEDQKEIARLLEACRKRAPLLPALALAAQRAEEALAVATAPVTALDAEVARLKDLLEGGSGRSPDHRGPSLGAGFAVEAA